jgi:hypothetical protein
MGAIEIVHGTKSELRTLFALNGVEPFRSFDLCPVEAKVGGKKPSKERTQ